jgi:hypothetical protein
VIRVRCCGRAGGRPNDCRVPTVPDRIRASRRSRLDCRGAWIGAAHWRRAQVLLPGESDRGGLAARRPSSAPPRCMEMSAPDLHDPGSLLSGDCAVLVRRRPPRGRGMDAFGLVGSPCVVIRRKAPPNRGRGLPVGCYLSQAENRPSPSNTAPALASMPRVISDRRPRRSPPGRPTPGPRRGFRGGRRSWCHQPDRSQPPRGPTATPEGRPWCRRPR